MASVNQRCPSPAAMATGPPGRGFSQPELSCQAGFIHRNRLPRPLLVRANPNPKVAAGSRSAPWQHRRRRCRAPGYPSCSHRRTPLLPACPDPGRGTGTAGGRAGPGGAAASQLLRPSCRPPRPRRRQAGAPSPPEVGGSVPQQAGLPHNQPTNQPLRPWPRLQSVNQRAGALPPQQPQQPHRRP